MIISLFIPSKYLYFWKVKKNGVDQLHRVEATGDSTEDGRDIESISSGGYGHVAVAENLTNEDGEDCRWELMSDTVGGF